MPWHRALPTRVALALAALAAGCVSTPALHLGTVTGLQAVDRPSETRGGVGHPVALDELSACLARARPVEQRSGQRWSHKLVTRGGHGSLWLYDVATGELQFLAMKRTPIYRIDEPDRARVEGLLAGPE
jgi:hypothetical protein